MPSIGVVRYVTQRDDVRVVAGIDRSGHAQNGRPLTAVAGVVSDSPVTLSDDLDQVVLAGMSANLCTQAHMHELLEQGFEVAVVKDGTAAAQIPEGDGYLAALINFRFMANAVWTTDQAVSEFTARS